MPASSEPDPSRWRPPLQMPWKARPPPLAPAQVSPRTIRAQTKSECFPNADALIVTLPSFASSARNASTESGPSLLLAKPAEVLGLGQEAALVPAWVSSRWDSRIRLPTGAALSVTRRAYRVPRGHLFAGLHPSVWDPHTRLGPQPLGRPHSSWLEVVRSAVPQTLSGPCGGRRGTVDRTGGQSEDPPSGRCELSRFPAILQKGVPALPRIDGTRKTAAQHGLVSIGC